MQDKKILWVECNFNKDEIDDDELDEGDFEEGPKLIKIPTGNMVSTPFGMMNVDDSMSPIRNTQFNIAHVNFDFTKSMVEKLSKCDGVEYLAPLGRYRFVVGFGVLFDRESVMASIEEILGIEADGKTLSQEMSDIIDSIKLKMKDSDRWVAYIFPNGNFIVKEASSSDDYSELITKTANLYKESKGVMLNKDEIYF